MPGSSTSISSSALGVILPVVCVTALACGDVPTVRRVAPLVIVSGNGQAGAPSTTLAAPLSIAIRDEFGNPTANVVVYWQPSDGGFVSPDSSLTDEGGIATALWTLGPVDGRQHVAAVSEIGAVVFEAVAAPNRSDSPFELTLATPDGSGQTVHPDFAVAQFSGTSSRDYLALTPYPRGNANYENPSLFTGTSPSDWSPPQGLTNPIARPAKGEYLSDPDIVYLPDRGELWVYYRAVAEHNVIRLIRTSDGIHFSSPVEVASADNHDLVSPAVVRLATNDWMMWSVNSNVGCSASSTSVELRRSIDGIHWGAPRSVELKQVGFSAWHIDVQWIPARSEFWAVYNGKVPGSCTTPALFVATSRDGVTWTTFPSPILERGVIPIFEDVVYRSTFAYDPIGDAIDFWYSGARYDGRDFNWQSAYQRRARSEVFATAGRADGSSLGRLTRVRPGRHTPELRDPP